MKGCLRPLLLDGNLEDEATWLDCIAPPKHYLYMRALTCVSVTVLVYGGKNFH